MFYWLTKKFKQEFVSYPGFLQSSITGVLYPATMRYYPSELTVVVDMWDSMYKLTPTTDNSYLIVKNDYYSEFFLSVKK